MQHPQIKYRTSSTEIIDIVLKTRKLEYASSRRFYPLYRYALILLYLQIYFKITEISQDAFDFKSFRKFSLVSAG
jgi:hypothetical protein